METNKKLINEKILKFYEKDFNVKLENGDKYFNKDATLNCEIIYNLLFKEKNRNDSLTLQEYQYEDYLQCYEKLKSIIKHSFVIYENVVIESLNLEWLGSNLKYLITTLKHKEDQYDETDSVEKTLMITAMLEYALGCVYYTLSNQRTPPHLLRDLLNTTELKGFFGLEVIIFLKIMLGSPKSINLRNVVWHGFPRPNDISMYYVSILVLTIHTLGLKLKQKQLNLKYRQQVAHFKSHVVKMQETMPVKFSLDFSAFSYYLENCDLLNKDYKLYWYKLFQYFQNADYLHFVVLILPQIELILRLKYAKVNDFDVSAKLDEYYITMDSIFEENLPKDNARLINANKLLSDSIEVCEGALNLMYDLFVAPNGPRLRDKVSHGEIAMEVLYDYDLSNILFYLSLNLLTENNSEFSLGFYESKFHLNSRTRESFLKANLTLQNLIAEHIPQFSKNEKLKFFNNRLKIFLRPKNEGIYMLLIFKIANLISQTAENYQESIVTRQILLARHELRSKRRLTFENLINTLPTICQILFLILKSLVEVFEILRCTAGDTFMDDNNNILRFLKHTLKIAENFIKYSNKDSNEWIKAEELCKAFEKLHKRLFLENKSKEEKIENFNVEG